MIPADDQATPIDIHTLDTLCDELVSGRAVTLDDGEQTFRLEGAETRALFAWYLGNRPLWPRPNQEKDVESLVDALDEKPPERPRTVTAPPATSKRVLHLRSMRAHRFAGLHRYGSPDGHVPVFELEFSGRLTLIEGQNATGKTSILSAICWCLTGHVYRSQRPPETVEAVHLELVESGEEAEDGAPSHDMSSITPVPSADELRRLDGKPLPLDTWVELTFEDDDGNEVGTIRRALRRAKGGRPEAMPEGFAQLGLDPIAYEVGTRLPGLIPYIILDGPSELGKAVAQLTGLRPLEDLATHARKSRDKLSKDLPRVRDKEIQGADMAFTKARDELTKHLLAYPRIAPTVELPQPGLGPEVEGKLAEARGHFVGLEAEALGACRRIIGESFDSTDSDCTQDLRDNVGPATAYLDDALVQKLPSMKRLRDLYDLTAEELRAAEGLLADLLTEALELAGLGECPDRAARERLYASIAKWLSGRPEALEDLTECPVCFSPLEKKTDPTSGQAIADHLREHIKTPRDYLAHTIPVWEESTLRRLQAELPEALWREAQLGLPGGPTELLTTALGDELLRAKAFDGSLSPLRLAAQTLCERHLAGLPDFEEPCERDIPGCLSDAPGGFREMARRLDRPLAFARWAHDHGRAWTVACSGVVGGVEANRAEPREQAAPIEQWPLADRLVALRRMVDNALPVTEALAKVRAMEDQLAVRRQKEQRKERYGRSVEAIGPIIELGNLAAEQVRVLMETLRDDMLKWRDHCYTPATIGGPKVDQTQAGADGSLRLGASVEGTRASASHISNASDLRATLLAFVVAYHRHVVSERGGLSLLLLDDPQELFDTHNRHKLAAGVAAMPGPDCRIVATTSDPVFRGYAARLANEALGPEGVDQREVHALAPNRACVQVTHLCEAVERKRRAFEQNVDDAQAAREYVNELRVYLEQQVLDLIATPDPGLPPDPALALLVNQLRALARSQEPPFSGKAFAALLTDRALNAGSEFMRLMNDTHHNQARHVTYGAVDCIKEDCRRVPELVADAHFAYDCHLRRDPVEPAADRPRAPSPIGLAVPRVPVLEDLAAFAADRGVGELSLAEDLYANEVLEHCALYCLRRHTFGFAAQPGHLAIVDLTEGCVEDQGLVIALHRGATYARRLLGNMPSSGSLCLSSEAENPLQRDDARILPASEVRLLKVVGILFDDAPLQGAGGPEASLVEHSRHLDRVEVAYRVTGDSALPLALPGQAVLGGRRIQPSELGNLRGRLVAIGTTMGSALKRIGEAIPGMPHVRLFESVGGHGDSLLIRTEEVEGDRMDSVPLMRDARLILGVLYDLA